jgi:DNA-directed RNA polymerase specialized sigma24 family protein
MRKTGREIRRVGEIEMVTEPNDPVDAWMAMLRLRLTEIARRRVQVDDVEDVVQSAMTVILQKRPELGMHVDGMPTIAWCLQVLRNVIGNHYRRMHTQRRHLANDVDVETVPRPVDSLASDHVARMIDESLDEIGAEGDPCGTLLRRLAQGAQPHELAHAAGLAPHALYQRLYRCRRRFRELLRRKGLLP